jgi:glutaredoxin/glutathione-dependent peroxiredoxin
VTIRVGDRMPQGSFAVMGSEGPSSVSTDELFSGKKVVLFAVPGAFTPTCSIKHLPGFVELAPAMREKGIDTIACLSVNDVFVMSAWGKASNVDDSILMLADGSADYTRALGLELDSSAFGMGIRSQRFAMIIEDGIVTHLNIDAPGQFDISSAQTILEQLA